jgi:hypothetical protein
MPSLSGSNQSHLIAALEYLGLISSFGAPSELLGSIVRPTGHDRSRFERKMLVDSYPFLFNEFDLKRATLQEVEEKFEGAGASGDTIRKCIKFFLRAAKGASIETSPFLTVTRRERRLPRDRKSRVRTPSHKKTGAKQSEQSSAKSVALELRRDLIARFPKFDPSWTDDLKGKWLDTYHELLKGKGS